MRLVLATRNQSKAEQIRLIFGEQFKIATLDDLGIKDNFVEEGQTLTENAEAKARFACLKTGCPALADDTGLFINALCGAPGVMSSRWAGESATTEEIRDFTLDKLKNVKEGDRGATFRTVAVLRFPAKELFKRESFVFIGEVRGKILTEPRCDCQPGMPYSAIFVPSGSINTWAEMSVEEENAVSHRGKAFNQVREFLLTQRASSL